MLRSLRLVQRLILIMGAIAAGCTTGRAQLPVFRNYNTQDGLPSSETYCVEQDERGYIYIGSDRGLTRFDGKHFETITTQNGLVNNTIFTLKGDRGKLWYYTYSALMGYLQDDTAHAYKYNTAIGQIMQSGLWSTFFREKNGLLYLNRRVVDKGYEIIEVDSFHPAHSVLSAPMDSDYVRIYATPGNRWLRTGLDKAKKVKLFSWETGSLLSEFKPDAPFKHKMVPLFGYRKGEHIWLLYKDVYRFRGKTGGRIITCDDPALYMLVDKEENVWLGYQNKGLVLYRKKDNYTKPIYLLDHHSVSGMLEDREGGLWFTTLEQGVYYLPPGFLMAYDARTGLSPVKVKQIIFNGKEIIALQSDFSLRALKNGTGGSWYRPLGNNTAVGMAGNNKHVYFTIEPHIPKPVPHDPQYIPVPASKIFHAGQFVWILIRGKLTRLDQEGLPTKTQITIKLPYIISIMEIQGDKLLLGCLDGLYLYENSQLQQLALSKASHNERMSDIQELDQEHWVIATSGQGLLVLDKRTYEVVRHITDAEGLKNMICNVVRCDSDGVVWVGTNKGLYKITHILDKPRTRIQWADVNDGISSNEIHDMCIINQDLWLATSKGISIFPRGKEMQHEDKIPVLIQQLSVNGVRFNTGNLPRLHYKQNNISISFIGLNYRYASVLQYQYRLRGAYNEAWSYTADPVVHYNSLPPGNYTFEYGAAAPNQSSEVLLASFSFTITPPFWRTWWFTLLMVIAVACCVLLFIHYRVKAIRKQVKLKTDLGIYRDKALRDQMSPHFIYNALNAIQNYILKHDTDMSVSFLSKFSRLMRLIFNNTVQEVVTLQKDLEALKLYAEMESMRFPGKLTFHLPERLQESLKPALIPPLLLQPFIENAVLHGLLPKNAPGNIWLTIEQDNDSILICIKDDGIGRAAAAKIKSRKNAFLNQQDMPSSLRKHTGTSITIARIAQAWGKSVVRSRFALTDLFHPDGSPSGTCIQFYLPLNYDQNHNR